MPMRDIYLDYLYHPEKLEQDLFQATRIDEHALELEKRDQASRFAYWAVLTSIAESEYQRQKRFIEVEVWPSVCAHCRAELEKNGHRATKERTEELAYLDKTYREAAQTRANLVHVLDIFKKIESALWQRKDMLQSMSRRETREQNAAPKPELKEFSDYVDSTLRVKDGRSVEELESIVTSVLGSKHGS